MRPLLAADVDAVLAPLERARPLPAHCYVEEDIFALERRAIFERAWRCVGREHDVAAPGTWLLAPLTEAGVLVARGADLELRAFHNVCLHRAMPLASGESGRASRFECPYHGWVYDSAGRLRSAPCAPSGFDPGSRALPRVRVGVWQGFVFVSLDPDAPPLEEALGAVPPWLARAPLDSLRRAHRACYDVGANWKLVVENFQESHHFPRVHPALERLTPSERATSWGHDGPWLGGVMELDGAETVSSSGRRHERPLLVPEPDARWVKDAMLFPTWLTSLQPDYLLTYALVPLRVDRTRVIAETFVHPSAAGSARIDEVIELWDRTNAEDRAVCERQQLGMRSGAYSPSIYSTLEDGVHAFDKLVAAVYREAR